MRSILIIGFGSILLFLVFVVIPRVLHSQRAANRIQAMNNARQLGLGLFEFDSTYGRCPDATTIPAVQAATSTTLTLGNSSSNDLLRQLIAVGLKSEKPFWAKTANSPRMGNNILESDALVKGECGFTYIAGLAMTGDPNTPLIMTPVIPGTWKFDRKAFGDTAVLLFLDNSVRALPIDKNGDVILNGMNLFDPRQPYWHGKPPDIKWPE